MKKQRQFRPTVDDQKLEERVVMSHVPYGHVAPWAVRSIPTVTQTQVKAVLTQIHSALVHFSRSMVPTLQSIQAQYVAGRISADYARNLAASYADTQFDKLNFQIRTYAHRLPYGGGFNTYLPPATATNPFPVYTAGLPSGGPSLYQRLSYVNNTPGPIGQISQNFFNALYPNDGGQLLPPDFNAAIASVSIPAMRQAYTATAVITQQYLSEGYHNGDFNYRR